MSCYTRHLAELLPPDPSAADKRALDRAIRKVLGMEEADCPDVWEQVKARRTDPYFRQRVGDIGDMAGHALSRPQAGGVAAGGPPRSSRRRASGGGGVDSPQSPLSETGDR